MASRQFKKFNIGVSGSGGIQSIPSPTEEDQKKSGEPAQKVQKTAVSPTSAKSPDRQYKKFHFDPSTGSSAVTVKLEAPKSPTSYGSSPVSPKSPWSGGSGSVSPNYDAPKYKTEVVEEVTFDTSKYAPVEIVEEVVIPSSHLQVEADRPRLHSVEDEFDEASSKSVHDKLKLFEDAAHLPTGAPKKEPTPHRPRSRANSLENILEKQRQKQRKGSCAMNELLVRRKSTCGTMSPPNEPEIHVIAPQKNSPPSRHHANRFGATTAANYMTHCLV
eukprot:TCONS_00032809-protein